MTASAENKFRILVVGDSLGRGVAAESFNGGFAYLVANELKGELGIMSSGSLYGAEQDWLYWGWKDVDLIIVELSLHDVGSEWGLIPDQEWAARYGAFLDLLHQETGAQIIATTTFWTGVTIATNPIRYNRILLYNGFITTAATSRSFVRLADVWGATENCKECISSLADKNPWETMGFQGDDFHPGSYGHQVIAKRILKTWQNKSYLPIIKGPASSLGP